MATGTAEKLRAELRRARQSGRVHGAYLFEGSEGSGAHETAHWFSRLLLCRAEGADPCEACPDCRKTSRVDGMHPDLRVVEPDGLHLLVGQIRELQKGLSLVANEGGWRVALLLGVEALRPEAANALLKTLEEPPPSTTLILVAGVTSGLPPTLRSRTTHLRFTPQPEARIEEALRREGMDPSDAWLVAALGGGSLEAARAWAEANLESARELCQALETLPGASPSEVLDFALSFRGAGTTSRPRTELLLAIQSARARRGVEAAARAQDEAGLARWLDCAEAAERARGELARRNLNPQLLVEGLLLPQQAGRR